MSIAWIGRLPLDRSWLRAAAIRARSIARDQLGLDADAELLQCSICRDPFVPRADRPRPQATCDDPACEAEIARWGATGRAAA